MCRLGTCLGLGLRLGLALCYVCYVQQFTVYMVSFTYIDLVDTVTAASLAHRRIFKNSIRTKHKTTEVTLLPLTAVESVLQKNGIIAYISTSTSSV